MFKLNKKHFYIIEAQGMEEDKRKLLKAELKVKGIDCEIIGYNIEIHEVKKNE